MKPASACSPAVGSFVPSRRRRVRAHAALRFGAVESSSPVGWHARLVSRHHARPSRRGRSESAQGAPARSGHSRRKRTRRAVEGRMRKVSTEGARLEREGRERIGSRGMAVQSNGLLAHVERARYGKHGLCLWCEVAAKPSVRVPTRTDDVWYVDCIRHGSQPDNDRSATNWCVAEHAMRSRSSWRAVGSASRVTSLAAGRAGANVHGCFDGGPERSPGQLKDATATSAIDAIVACAIVTWASDVTEPAHLRHQGAAARADSCSAEMHPVPSRCVGGATPALRRGRSASHRRRE